MTVTTNENSKLLVPLCAFVEMHAFLFYNKEERRQPTSLEKIRRIDISRSLRLTYVEV